MRLEGFPHLRAGDFYLLVRVVLEDRANIRLYSLRVQHAVHTHYTRKHVHTRHLVHVIRERQVSFDVNLRRRSTCQSLKSKLELSIISPSSNNLMIYFMNE